MQCPNCQNEVREGAVFCGSCGAAIPAAATVPQSASAAEQAEYERQMAEYQRKQAAYEQQKAAYEQYQQQAAGQTTQQPTVAAPQPVQAQPAMAQQAPKKKTGLIIGIIAAVVLALGGVTVAGILIARSAFDEAVEEIGAEFEVPVTGDEETPVDTPTGSAGYATAEEAAAAALAEQGYGDWVTQLYKEDEALATYWAGPPNSEWVSELTISKQGDGTWKVDRVEDLQFGGDVPLTLADEAALVVTDFLMAIQQDRADDAHSLTIEPFSLDGASAAYSNGEFTSFEIVSVEEQSDGTAWVQTSETWYGTASEMWYYVVPTDAGYRISSAEVR